MKVSCKHNLSVLNGHGITFGDVRMAVKEFLAKHADDREWRPCKSTITVVSHASWQRHKQIKAEGSDEDYDNGVLLLECSIILFGVGSFVDACRASPNDLGHIIFCGALTLLAMVVLVSPITAPMVVALFKEVPKSKPCEYALHFQDGVPVTTEEKLTLESIGVVRKVNDPYYAKPHE